MLNLYYRRKGNSFTKLKLVEALHASNLRSVAEKIYHVHPSELGDIVDGSAGDY